MDMCLCSVSISHCIGCLAILMDTRAKTVRLRDL